MLVNRYNPQNHQSATVLPKHNTIDEVLEESGGFASNLYPGSFVPKIKPMLAKKKDDRTTNRAAFRLPKINPDEDGLVMNVQDELVR